jgi:hypothetical protein
MNMVDEHHLVERLNPVAEYRAIFKWLLAAC